jgi:3-oxoacyl-[acyl-carrier protein] reductase
MDLGIAGRVAMIAASSRGLGKAAATSLAREGCRVSICGRDARTLDATAREIQAEAAGAKVLATPCDLTRPDAIETWHRATVEAWGPVDILVTNSGGPPAGRLLDLSEADWKQGIDSTLFNVVRLCRLVVPAMRERRWGRIVHITSFTGRQPMELLTVSSTLRAGLSALTRTMSNELAKDGICVTALMPGHVMTDRQRELNEIRSREAGVSVEEWTERARRAIPAGRHGKPSEIGDVVAFLASARASYLTGATLPVDGGLIQGTF